MLNESIREAVLAMASSRTMFEAGLTPEFAEEFARNHEHFEKLPESTQTMIRKQFARQAMALSYLEGVACKHSETKERALVGWMKGVNLLLAMQGNCWGNGTSRNEGLEKSI